MLADKLIPTANGTFAFV